MRPIVVHANAPLENPLVRRKLQVEIAHAKLTHEQLGEKYGVSQQAISAFGKRHRETINRIRDDAANEFAGLVIAEKAARLAVYEELLTACLKPVPKTTGGKGEYVIDPETGTPVMEIDAGVAAKILRNVAEELGHLPNRVTLGGEVGVKTNYVVNGVEPGNLT